MEKKLLLQILFRIAKKYQVSHIISLYAYQFHNEVLSSTHLSKTLVDLQRFIRRLIKNHSYKNYSAININKFYQEIELVLNKYVRKKVFDYLTQNDLLEKCLHYHYMKYPNYLQLSKTITFDASNEFIMSGFSWVYTEEGSPFWNNHYHQIYKLFKIK